MIRILYLSIILIGFYLPKANAQENGTLQVEIHNIKAEAGTKIIICLFKNGENWLKTDKSFRVKSVAAETSIITVSFENLPLFENYAVEAFHDLNKNETLDLKFPIPIPKEPVGISNDHSRIGPPLYDKASFVLKRNEQKIRFKMNY